MVKNMVIVALVAAFIFTGTAAVMAGDSSSACDKNVLQSMYDWCSGCGKGSSQGTECRCKSCNKTCCKACNSDCGGKCCADCGKK